MKRIFCLILLCLLLTSCGKPAKEWTKSAWDSASWHDRQDYVTAFLDTHELIGMTRDEVTALLGHDTAADPAMADYSIRYKTDTNLVYDFGEDKSAKSANLALVVEFGTDGRVSEVRMERYSQ